jgi:hypothetical protein
MFEGLLSRYFEGREEIVARGLKAKEDFVEKFYRPSRGVWVERMEKVARGEIDESTLRVNLMRFIVTGAEPDYEDEDLAIREAILFFIAAAGTSVQAICWTVFELSKWFQGHPEDWDKRNDPEFLTLALQEAVRLKGSFVEFQTRLAAGDFEINGKPVVAGQEIHVHFGRAGRDAEVFGSDPDTFNPHREVASGVPRYGHSFASGPHQCLGLRIVLGNEGRGGSHVHTLRKLFEAGVAPDPNNPASMVPMVLEPGDMTDIGHFASYPVMFSNWHPELQGQLQQA